MPAKVHVRTRSDAMREAANKRQGRDKPLSSPLPGADVFDPDRGWGVVVKSAKNAACWIQFADGDPVYYSLRTALNRWLAFPGPADAPGLQLDAV